MTTANHTDTPGGQLRSIAFYLPQFHPIAENDAWWGKGFTEWTNVTRAEPLFEGHNQPRRPADLGYYDLRVPEIMEQQAALARQHGIHGFCYYYYWFAGRRLLERPLDRMLASGSPDFPFCLCWANENWSRRWDGSEQEVLMKQEYGPDYARRIIRDMMPFLQDKRYITVDGKPLLLVYRVDIIPDCAEMTAIWREEAISAGLPGLYLVRVESFVELDPRPYGFDAACEFPPHLLNTVAIVDNSTLPKLNPAFEGCVFDYSKVARHYGDKPAPAGYKRFKGLVPSWDNTARKKLKPYVLDRSTPDLYKAWLSQCLRDTAARFTGDERLVFINAWNEWAEGCYLEPDQKFGHQYLEATRDAHAAVTSELRATDTSQRPAGKGMDFAIALFNNGQLTEAYESFVQVLQDNQSNPLALVYLGLIALASELPDDASNFFTHAVDCSQDRANTMAAIGQRCMEAGYLQHAEVFFSAAIETQPALYGAYALLADVLEQQGRLNEAMHLLASLVAGDSHPQQAVLARLVTLARRLADPEQERATCLRAARFPDSHARAIELMRYADNVTPEQIRDECLRFATAHAGQYTQQLAAGSRQRLRIGFVVGRLDLSDVAWRLEPLLRQLDPERFETIIIACDATPGEAAQRLFLLADNWLTLTGMDADRIHEAIRVAGIDVLINTDGHASLATLQPFVRRSAPLQLNWSVPPTPLSLSCIDYALLDPLTDPAMLSAFAEKTVQINRVTAWTFPTRSARLIRRASPFTFGCLAPIQHISVATWQAWAEILTASPFAHLQLNTSGAGSEARQRVLQLFSAAGIEVERIRWVDAPDSRSVCEAWRNIDLALSPLAGDMLHEALLAAHSATPVLCASQSRTVCNLQRLLENDDLIAPDILTYTAKATALAQDSEVLRMRGQAIQSSLKHSAVIDAAGFAEAFGATLLQLWQGAGGQLEISE
ncbi:glycoside hydrolase family 99-like domain-containing protein [Viridibacterium curvum]|uniref:Glycosyltransferase n=1 Tax=Viridibacterium curvum TaxID=1101404 RepID=A0ABP9R0R9_9RHOO